MTETISWAGMTETPLVIVDHQRGAPATGLPTRTEQGDLSFILNLGHGDYSRIVIAPGSIEEYIIITALAFNYADKFQLPVIVVGEKSLTQSSLSIEKSSILDIKDSYKVDRGKLIDNGGDDYKRYKFTQDNVSERIKLGDPTAIMWIAGDEHDEWGHISEDPNNRNIMMEKRNGKDDLILSSLPKEEKFNLLGDPAKADILVIGWGGPSKAIAEAIKPNMAFLQIKLIKPFPKEISSIIKTSKKTVCVEQNFSGQLRSYIASETGIIIENQILKYNGRPMRYDEVSEGLDKIMEGERKVVLNAY
jgi:2-oxoglutarate ferredoxin oxidoreductase subunit alpha